MEYREEADGSAVVHGIAVAPFVPVQHMQIDISAVNLLANYCFRFARERGWLQTREELAMATPYAENNEARPLIESEGHAYRTTDNTFFFAGVEEALANPRPHFHHPPTPSTLFVCAKFYLVHVGNSSYGVYCRLYTYLDGQPPETRMQHLLGTFKVTTVWVSKQRRTPAPLTHSKRDLFYAILERGEAARAELCGADVRVQRLSVPEMLRNSGWFENDAAVAAMQLRTTVDDIPSLFSLTLPAAAAGAATTESASLSFLHHRAYTLRETDIDFNLHVNQLVSKVFVINAFRSAVADPNCAYARLLRPGELPLRSDLLLRRFRIDYVREIPMRYAAVEVFLFPLDVARITAQYEAACSRPPSSSVSAADGAASSAAEMVEIGFFTVGVPAGDGGGASSEKFIATIGVMTAAACFLPDTLKAA